jgi:hypothetical protein
MGWIKGKAMGTGQRVGKERDGKEKAKGRTWMMT